MKRSTDRFRTTHVGSLPRPDDLLPLIGSADTDEEQRRSAVRKAVADVVASQIAHGVDVVNDGEMGKESYATYVRNRLFGFEGEGEQPVSHYDVAEFPGFAAKLKQKRSNDISKVMAPPACSGPIGLRDGTQVRADVADLREAADAAGADEVFMSSASPGLIALFFANHHYESREAYVMAIGEAMRDEYEAIADAGIVLQLDCPDLAMGRHAHVDFRDRDVAAFRREAALNVEALNEATRNIDPDRMRMHLCWGNYEAPHQNDVPLPDIVDIVLRARPLGLALEGANPRHEHEWAVFEDIALPEGKVLIPGVLDTTCNYVEHPDLIAQRIQRYAEIVGRENVIAGTDCGFGTFAGNAFVDPEVMWAKFDAMAEGARRADAKFAGRSTVVLD